MFNVAVNKTYLLGMLNTYDFHIQVFTNSKLTLFNFNLTANDLILFY